MSPKVHISVVVPIYNEVESLPVLFAEIQSALTRTDEPWEVLFVDDRSDDGSMAAMLAIRAGDPGHVRIVALRGRSGQTAAMAAGFDHARGDIVVTLDGDLQNDPADIPLLLHTLRSGGYDVVAGWRKSRQDGFVLRRLPSRIANRLIAWVTGVKIHDTGCTLKAFRREVVRAMPIYAEQHRFLPAISAGSGAHIAEVVVNHRPRRFGSSKYGLGRAMRVLSDLLAIKMLSSFSQRPLQYFVLCTLPCAAFLFVLLLDCLRNYEQLSLTSPWTRGLTTVVFLNIMMCVYFVMLGLLAELVVKASGLHRSHTERVLVRSLDRVG
ncbi:MAG: glycosyltransferase family 2 protein [Planctomycetota bacterium]